ncbi:hypothetical protein [Salinarchaeum sp. Harcht-Bsk1]|uniref:hypothetical protein n=1 Tax=Salinarchaeum sp. Harcht-Bsk1 TaxID=1333523 RepID=UPI001F18552E|nr:hypothetical protein [Salinarchaeum sp. Harcht-Bsk1]
MAYDGLRPLADFGTRSLVTHAIMVVTLLGAVVSAFVLEGEVGLVSFVAFVNFTAGVWICQSIHSLGNAYAGGEYQGVIQTLRERGR